MRRILPLVMVAVVVALVGPAMPGQVVGAVDHPTAALATRPVALFFGDSYFVGGGCSPDRTRDMAFLAGRRLGYRPIVRGGGGTGFVTANEEYGIPDYLGQISDGALAADDPQLVVVEGGTNDLGRAAADVRRNAAKVLTAAQRAHPDALLVLVGPMSTYGPVSASSPIRNALQALAERRAVPFVDVQRWTRGHDEWLCDDYVHPTYAGHDVLGRMLAEALAARGA